MARATTKKPPEVMTWGKAAPVLAISAIADLLRLFFESFWFFGPAIGALYCSLNLGSTLASWSFGLLGSGTATSICAVGGAALGLAGMSIMAPLGVLLSMAAGFAGWLTVGVVLLASNSRIFKENALWFGGSLVLGIAPIVNAAPSLTVIVWKMYATQIKTEKAALKKYQEENAEQLRRENEARQAAVAQAQAAQPTEAEIRESIPQEP